MRKRCDQAANREAQAGPDEKSASERGECGDGLSCDATGFAGVREANPGAKFAAAVVTGERLPADFGGGFAIQRELPALVGTAAVAGVDREGEVWVGGSAESRGDRAPVGDAILCVMAQGVEAAPGRSVVILGG